MRHGARGPPWPSASGVRPGAPTSCPLSRVSFDAAPSPLDTSSGFFKAPLKPRAGPEGWGSCTWAQARARGAGWGRLRVPAPPLRRRRRRAGRRSGRRGPGKRPVHPLSPAGEPRGRGPHKALLWLGDGRHRVAFVPPLTSRQARLIAGPGQGAGYVPGGSAQPGLTADTPGLRCRLIHTVTTVLMVLRPGHCPDHGTDGERALEESTRPSCTPD